MSDIEPNEKKKSSLDLFKLYMEYLDMRRKMELKALLDKRINERVKASINEKEYEEVFKLEVDFSSPFKLSKTFNGNNYTLSYLIKQCQHYFSLAINKKIVKRMEDLLFFKLTCILPNPTKHQQKEVLYGNV